MRTSLETLWATSLVVAVSCLTACSTEDREVTLRSIDPVCLDDDDASVPENWVCGDPLTLDCTAEVPDEIMVVLEGDACADVDLIPVDGPFVPGTHDVVIVDDNTGAAVCQSTLVITDAEPPAITTREQSMWPPNHKFHTFELEDCFEDVIECDPDWFAYLTWVSSDEPVNERGDGNSEPDIVVLSDVEVDLRSERQGGGNGRVYTLGWVAEDGSGNTAQGECIVTVDHDQSKKKSAIDDGEAYRIDVGDV